MADGQREHARGVDAPAVRQHHDRRGGEHVRYLVVRQETEPPVDPLVHAKLGREALQRLDGVEWIAGDDEPYVRAVACHEWKRAQQEIDTLVGADQAEEEERLAARVVVGGGACALEHRVRNPGDARTGNPELHELVGAAPRMHDDAVDGL